MDILVTGIKQNKEKDAFIKSIFTSSKLEWFKEKTNILGCFLGQGLQDLHLPCEIFRTAETLYMVKGKYTDNENREIMKTMVKQNESAFKHNCSLPETDPILTELCIKLNRRPRNIYDHWERFIKPRILQFENKMEIWDIRRDLIEYFVEKGIKDRSEINWGEIIKDKRFKGKTTPLFLSRKFADMMSGVKKANPDIEARDITIEDLRQYSDERAKIPYKDKHFSTLIEDYVNIKNSM